MSEQEAKSQDQVNESPVEETQAETAGISALNKAVIAALILLGVVLLIQFTGGDEADLPVATTSSPAVAGESVAAESTSENVAILDRDAGDDVVTVGGIERRGEGRHFFTTIKVPAGAESLYLSGSGASRWKMAAGATWSSRLSTRSKASNRHSNSKDGQWAILFRFAPLLCLMNLGISTSKALIAATASSSAPKKIR